MTLSLVAVCFGALGPNITACKSSSTANTRPADSESRAASPGKPPGNPAERSGQHFGAPARTDVARAQLSEVLAQPLRYQGQTLSLEGTVRRVCQKKGCWMELSETGEGKTAGCRVTFQDYSFFVPTDSTGARARVQAQVQVEQVSKAAVDHMEREGAAFTDKQPDGTAREVRLVASAVDLYR